MSKLPSKKDLTKEIILTNEIVWGRKIFQSTIDEWLSNFQGEVFEAEYEHRLALWLLSNFVYYNDLEVKHLCKSLYRDYIHRRLVAENMGSLLDSIHAISSSTMYSSLGKQGESGSMLLYLFRTANEIGRRDIVPENGLLNSGVNTLVFVDDVTLSVAEDNQAWNYVKSKLGEYTGSTIYLLTLVASDKAIQFFASKKINVISAITLTDECKAFHSDSFVFQLNRECKDDAMKLANHYGKICHPSDPLGYSNGQYLFGFYYNVPDNTLPIIWSKVKGWKPIFERYHKNYGKTKPDEYGSFV